MPKELIQISKDGTVEFITAGKVTKTQKFASKATATAEMSKLGFKVVAKAPDWHATAVDLDRTISGVIFVNNFKDLGLLTKYTSKEIVDLLQSAPNVYIAYGYENNDRMIFSGDIVANVEMELSEMATFIPNPGGSHIVLAVSGD